MNFAKRSIVLFSSLLALSACKAFDKEEPPLCPRVSALADSVTLTKFKPGPGRDLTDVELKAEMTSYHGSCHYDAEAKQMHVLLEVGIDAERRPGLAGRTAQVAYYIAVPTFYPDPKAKQILPVTLQFADDSNRLHYTDSEVDIAIPMANFKDLTKYEVFVGLQLTPDELAFNRQQKRGR
ncbi:hypothetical protein [Telmatospirillum siberiense]|uniref:Lipoprotein n=1 Tax=Telmatospirillum siberiense TaxID=382514 RepID=A0A2N3PTL4_9PROT|nr:hypothetical protein [Telmatospirillum siberiense]PKU23751.1 hypothetical protein CWS72_14750 [Telmatospirillum siberiense]